MTIFWILGVIELILNVSMSHPKGNVKSHYSCFEIESPNLSLPDSFNLVSVLKNESPRGSFGLTFQLRFFIALFIVKGCWVFLMFVLEKVLTLNM